ncbi:MAG: rhodanese-related sulfurtransferase [Candidatus Saccharibacteria bacterium]|nr:rhodanese-related sulfurtransferase [Candidatus Saccharibacteria bacterium]
MEKIILYYKFVPVDDPETVKFWQRNLCERLNLRGRIIISRHGINGTLGGDIKNLKLYRREMNEHPSFKKIQYKWSDGSQADFPRLSVKVRPELVTLAPEEDFDVFGSTKGLSPQQWHDYIEKHPDVLILDARNEYESEIGAFKGKNVIKPKINAFREIKPELEKLPKDRPILTYCTGDIRCEYLSAYMKHKGFDEVYHLDGGIVKYGQEYKDKGHWEGRCFVFDNRLNIAFSEDAKDIGECIHCGERTSNHQNCANQACNLFALVCEACTATLSVCSGSCADAVNLETPVS